MNTQHYIEQLYRHVDNKDVDGLATHLDKDVTFSIANANPVNGKQDVLDANGNFFNSIKSMQHEIDNVWAQDDAIICNGRVNYRRLDDSALSVPFATVLKMSNNQIRDYRVYADLSAL